MDLPPGIGGMPKAAGSAARLAEWLASSKDAPGASFLLEMVPWAVEKFSFDADKFVHELVDSIIGDNYPVPDRMLEHNEIIVREYLEWAMCGQPRPEGTFKLYAVEGGTAAMCYIFKSLKSNRLLNPGDTIALSVPIFTPYLEMPLLEDYGLNVVNIQSLQENRFQIGDDLDKLLDPKIKAFFVVNPGNPSAMALSGETIARIGEILIPQEEVVEMRNGKKVNSKRLLYPGYVLVQMEMDETLWHAVKDTPRVTGFVGGGNHPVPLSADEVNGILYRQASSSERVRPKVSFEKGEQVRITDGPFTNFTGKVDEINPERDTLRVLVTIFGRATPVELDFLQVEKVN